MRSIPFRQHLRHIWIDKCSKIKDIFYESKNAVILSDSTWGNLEFHSRDSNSCGRKLENNPIIEYNKIRQKY